MSAAPLILAHIGAGLIALCLYWAVLTQKKGSDRHKRFGRLFLLTWVPVLATVGLIMLGNGGMMDPADVIQFLYLSICVIVVSATAYLSLRLKHDLAAFRGRWFRFGGGVIFALGLVLLLIGVSQGLLLPVAFSSVGLIFGGGMLAFALYRGPVHPRWPLIWHLNATTFLFNAVHGTLLAVIWRWAVDPGAGEGLNVVTHLLTLAACLGMRVHYGRRHKAPLAFGPVPALGRA